MSAMFASEKVMLDYLSQLLTEEESAPESEQRPVNMERKQTQPVQPEITPSVTKPSASDVSLESVATRQNIKPSATEAVVKPTSSSPDIEPKVKLNPIKSSIAELKPYKEQEDAPVKTLPETDSVAKLLQQVSIKQQELQTVKEETKTVDEVATQTQVASPKVEVPVEQVAEDVIPEEPFQALFFDVAGLQLAVPLQELGGIHNLTEVNSLLGKPSWFHGVMLTREQKINVVDSARWVMPEKYDKNLEQAIDYQYVIMLGESNWGLTAEKLVETELLPVDAVKWRKGPGKRPWLFGTIKEKMCALLHVSDLIAMLDQGINARQE